jgi:hypothetical protein
MSQAPARRAFVVGGVLIAVVAIGAVLLSTLSRPADRTETGVVIDVDAASLGDVRGFTLRTNDGRSVTFTLGPLQNPTEFAPGHLAEHQATSTPIVVTYRDEAGARVAVRLEDAPLESPGGSA